MLWWLELQKPFQDGCYFLPRPALLAWRPPLHLEWMLLGADHAQDQTFCKASAVKMAECDLPSCIYWRCDPQWGREVVPSERSLVMVVYPRKELRDPSLFGFLFSQWDLSPWTSFQYCYLPCGDTVNRGPCKSLNHVVGLFCFLVILGFKTRA